MKKVLGLAVVVVFLAVASMFTASCSSSNPTTPATDTPTVGATATATSTATPLYNFEVASQLNDWTTDIQAFFSPSIDTTGVGHNGSANCVSVTTDFNSTTIDAYFVHYQPYVGSGFTSYDMTGKTFSAWINIPAGMVDSVNPYRLQIFIQNQAWQWEAKSYNITAAGWQQFTMGAGTDYTSAGCTFSNPTNVTDIIKWGIKIERGSSTQNCTDVVKIDDINW